MLPAFNQEIHQLHSSLCYGLSDPIRILILYLLREDSLNVTQLAQRLDIPQPTASRHLKVLRERGLVIARREAQSVYYLIADERIMEALELMRSVIADMLQNQADLLEKEKD